MRASPFLSSLRPWMLLAPALILLLPIFVLPVLGTIPLSLQGFDSAEGITDEFGLQNYINFFGNSFNVGVLLTTIKLSGLTTLICVALAFPIATQFARSQARGRAIIALIVLMPLLVSVVVRTYGWFAILGPNGAYERLMIAIGVEQPPRIFYSETAVLIGLVHINLAYMVLAIVSSLDNINPNNVLAARNLGSGPFTAFRKITLPLALPGVIAGSLLVFALASGSLITPALLGGQRGITLARLAYQQELVLFNWPLGSAISLILLAMIGVTMLIYRRTVDVLAGPRAAP